MSDASNSLRPYSFKLDGDMHYVFTTEAGVVYHAYFIDFSMYAPQFKEVYMFNIEPEGDTTYVTVLTAGNTSGTCCLTVGTDITQHRKLQSMMPLQKQKTICCMSLSLSTKTM